MTQSNLATIAGIHQPRLSQFERGEAVPSVAELLALSSALKVDVLELMGVSDAGAGHHQVSRRLGQLLGRITAADRKLLIQIAELMAKRAKPEP